MTLPAGAIRTGFAIAAGLALLAQFGVVRRGVADAWAVLALHALCAGLAYLLFVNLTKRRLGAPLIAAALFAVHPAAVPTLSSDGGWRAALGAALALLAGVLLARTPLQPRLLWPSLAVYAASLPLAPGAATVPFLVAAAVVGYHALEPRRLLGKRLLPRFAVFLVPLVAWAIWLAASGRLAAAPGFAPVPDAIVAAFLPCATPGFANAPVGAAFVAAAALLGFLRLRSSPKAAWPLLAAALSFTACALLPTAWDAAPSCVLLPLVFLMLLAAEGIEDLFFRFGAAVAMPLLLVLLAALAVLSHVRVDPSR